MQLATHLLQPGLWRRCRRLFSLLGAALCGDSGGHQRCRVDRRRPGEHHMQGVSATAVLDDPATAASLHPAGPPCLPHPTQQLNCPQVNNKVLDKTSTRKLMQTIAGLGPAACLIKLAADQVCGALAWRNGNSEWIGVVGRPAVPGCSSSCCRGGQSHSWPVDSGDTGGAHLT